MLRFTLCLGLSCFLAFLSAITASQLLGTQLASPSTLFGFVEGCESRPQPCWHGIVPGTTSLQKAQAILEERGYTNPRSLDQITVTYDAPPSSGLLTLNLIHQGSYLQLIGLYPHDSLPLASVVARLGIPDGLTASSPRVYIGVAYGRHVRIGLLDLPQERLSPYAARIRFITLNHEPVEILPWHGFLPLWRYCHFEPDHPAC